MQDAETPREFRDRMRSVGFISRARPLEKTITRKDDGSGNLTDVGRKAKVVINEDRDIVTTTSDNRQDVNIFGKPAVTGSAGGTG
jgi:hypothetical protein